MRRLALPSIALPFVVYASLRIGAQTPVPYERLLNASMEPQNYLMYGGDYFSQRYSRLTQITPANAKNVALSWVYQSGLSGTWETTPLVVDGVMYLTQRPNTVTALDAATGRVFWTYAYNTPPDVFAVGTNNRGLAILGDRLFMGTLDASLVAIDTKSGRPIWTTRVVDRKQLGPAGLPYSIGHAPLVVKDRVIVGMAGGEGGIRGFLAAFDAATGKEAWRFNTIPAPGEPGAETWEPCPPEPAEYCDPEAWKHGGGSVWITGSYDAALNLTYWGIGNPGPWNANQRPGDNLYTASVVALDADTGKLKWHYQFTPHDRYDFDATQVPVLADITWQGRPVKALLFANRNGNFYVLDRTTGKFLLGKPFTRVNWMSGFDANGLPIQTPQTSPMPTFPGIQGGTNWYAPSFSPRTGLFYVTTWQDQGGIVNRLPEVYKPGKAFIGTGGDGGFVPSADDPTRRIPGAQNLPALTRGPINSWTEAAGHGAIVAIDPNTGQAKWKYPMTDVSDSGVLTTATDLLITGNREGYLQILDARTGALIWRANLGAQMMNGPITYAINGKQYISAISGLSLFTFALSN